MLDPTPNREELLLRPIVSSPAVRGSVLVLGRSDWFVTEALAKREVSEVTYVPGGHASGLHSHRLREMIGLPPALSQRRMIQREAVDFLFCDLSSHPWDRARVAAVKKQVHEFRPRATAYRYVQLDIVAEWMGAGYEHQNLNEGALSVFAAKTGIWVEPRSAVFAASCMDAAKEFMGRQS